MTKSRLEDIFSILRTPENIDVQEARDRKLWTPDHISRVVGISMPHVRRHLTTLQLSTPARAHIIAWTTQHPAPVWAQGPGENAPRPRGMTMAEHQAKYRKDRTEGVSSSKPGVKEGQSLNGRSRARTYETIEKARAAGPQTWWSPLGSMKPEETTL